MITNVSNEECEPLFRHCLSKWLVIPAHPIFLNFFQFVYLTNRSVDKFQDNIAPDFVCFNATRCSALSTNVVAIDIISGLTCCSFSNLTETLVVKDFYDATKILNSTREKCLRMGNEKSCINSSYFHCNKSMKCIANHRVQDGTVDCFFKEDELFNTCQWNDSNRFQCPSDLNICLSPIALGNTFPDCPFKEDEQLSYEQNIPKLTPYPEICHYDSHSNSMDPEHIKAARTNCSWWPCATPYTRCDSLVHCFDGADELICPNSVCPFDEYPCEYGWKLFYCLSRDHLYDEYLDPCPETWPSDRKIYFYNGTSNIDDHYLSWKNVKCLSRDNICRVDHGFQTILEDVCSAKLIKIEGFIDSLKVKHYGTEKELCRLGGMSTDWPKVGHFLNVDRLGYYPALLMNYSNLSVLKILEERQKPIYDFASKLIFDCNRGIPVLNGLNETKQCLCPPNFFGDRCQWQSQRISLTLHFQWFSSTPSSFTFQVIIMLIDNDGHIAPNHEQILYEPIRDCMSKYNIYLLYPDRPKSLSKNYSLRIDIYERNSLTYWGSWHLSMPFSFLPVIRISTQLVIPDEQDNQFCTLPCGHHGKCKHYINKKSSLFCQCDKGYSGTYCNITHQCNCANDSICLSSSICICPLYKFGSYCYVKHPICQPSKNPCENNGLCVPYDDRINLTRFTCICSEQYSGERCQTRNTQITIQLNELLTFETSEIFVYFITTIEEMKHDQMLLLKKFPFDQKTLTFYATQPFNILFVRTTNDFYYSVVLREFHVPSEDIYTEIQRKNRCSNITELLNSTYSQYEYIRRVKYYPLMCRQYSELMCFYDDDNLMCVCDLDRFANCFFITQTENRDCHGNNHCQNGGQCFQNNINCPTEYFCICPNCYYGDKCQYSTSALMFSLDPILGYHIKPDVSISRQPMIITIGIVINMIMIVAALINGYLSIITFGREKSRTVGTGNYLLISSIISIFMIIILTYKFWQLVLSQALPINNRSFLKFNCIVLDVILKTLLATSDWLNACVAVERTISVIKTTNFDKKKSKVVSKWVIIIVIVLIILTNIHDPIHRKLIDDADIDEKRIWCLVEYLPSVSLNRYNSFITLFHFISPFLINLISGVWLIISIARRRSDVKRDQTFKQHLKDQINTHRHIIIAPCLLILLSLPRIIISLISGCMRTVQQPRLHFIGYFISFVPSILTFVVYVLPSQTYKDEFHAAINQRKRRFRAILFHP